MIVLPGTMFRVTLANEHLCWRTFRARCANVSFA